MRRPASGGDTLTSPACIRSAESGDWSVRLIAANVTALIRALEEEG
jgi:hypothetical protein